MNIDPVIERYFQGKAVSRKELGLAFKALGEETKNMNSTSEDYQQFLQLEKLIFKKRNELVESVKAENVPENELSNHIIRRLLETEAGSVFFFDVIIPYYRPTIEARARAFLMTENVDDFVSSLIYGRHIEKPLANEEAAKTFNYSGSLFTSVIKFGGDSNFHTYIYTFVRNNYYNHLKKSARAAIPFTNMRLDGDVNTDDTADRLIGDSVEHNQPASQIGYAEAVANAVDFWQRKLLDAPMKANRRQIITLLAQGMGQEDIAKALDMPTGTVRSSLHYARKTIESILAEGKATGRLDGMGMEIILNGFIHAVGNGHHGETAATQR